MSLLRRLGLVPKAPEPPTSPAIRATLEALGHLPPEEARRLAAFAYLLGRVAHADLEVNDQEVARMEALVSAHAGLPGDQAAVAVQIARTHNELFGGTEHHRVARVFDEMASRDEKLALLDCLFAVAAADERITVVEDNEIRLVANELGLTHRDFIAVRSRWRDHLAVLQDD